ncbi:MAG: sugar transferase [Geodermatophilaceae bacterium]
MTALDDEVVAGPKLSTESLLAGSAQGPWHRTRVRLSRFGTPPYVLAVDLVAIGAACLWLRPSLASFGVLVLAIVGHLQVSGRYRSRLALSALDDLPSLALGCLLGVGAVVVIGPFDQIMAVAVFDHPRLVGALLLFLVLGRSAMYAVVRSARRRGLVRHSAIILGSGSVGRRVARILIEHPEYGLAPVGMLDTGPPSLAGDPPVARLGSHRRLGEMVRRFDVRVILVATDEVESDVALVETLRSCAHLRSQTFLVPHLHQLVGLRGRDIEEAWGIPLVRLPSASIHRQTRPFKRLLDVVVATAGIFLAAPVLAAVALAVRIEGGPGVLFRQERIGRDGRPFTVLKFRSMRPADVSESDTAWSIDADPRVGPVGRFIRVTALDELPQLWNVLRGQMSLVGPRPERQHFVSQFSARLPWYEARHRVPVGLTGWAQIHGLRGDTSVEDRASFDNNYIESWSLWMDIKILVRTVSHVLATVLARPRRGPDGAERHRS